MRFDTISLSTGKVAILNEDIQFPDPTFALKEPNGLLAVGGDLSPERIIQAYKMGIFPWYNPDEPILWWSPDPRFVLFPQNLKISTSLTKLLKKNNYEIRFNTAFEQVIHACAQTPRKHHDGIYVSTWISDEMMNAYIALHYLGYAHSAETWINGQLVGGLYGVKIGKVFYGESMFHHQSNASKIAWVHMVKYLINQGVELIDCQMETSYLASFGATPFTRSGFLQLLSKLVH